LDAHVAVFDEYVATGHTAFEELIPKFDANAAAFDENDATFDASDAIVIDDDASLEAYVMTGDTAFEKFEKVADGV